MTTDTKSKTLKLTAGKFGRAEYVTTRYAAAVDAGTSIEDLERPAFWIHVARDLKRMDTIVILPEDEAYYAEVLVLSTGTGYAKVKVISHLPLIAGDAEDEECPVETKWRGPACKWSVLRKSDATVLKDGFADKAEAETFARQYERAIAA